MNINEDQCRRVRELLVDYADRQLSTDQAREVGEHLERCRRCGQLLEELHRSLDLAQRVWRESAATLAPGAFRAAKSRRQALPWRRYVAAAVAVAGCLALAAASFMRHRATKREVAGFSQITPEEAERLVRRAESAARLLACADILEGQPGMQDYARDVHRYVAQTYGGAEARKLEPKEPVSTRRTP
jgi:anti-sigma factor RsiW